MDVVAFQADRLAPPQAGIGDRDDHGEVLVPAGQQRGPLGNQQRLQRRRPHPLRATVEPAAGPASAVAGPDRGVVRDQRRLGRGGVARIVHSTARASRATRRETPVRAGMEFSHLVMSSVVSEPSSLAPKEGRMNRRIRYSRFSTVLSPCPAWTSTGRSIADRDLPRVRVGPAALADPGLLVTSPGERGGLGLEAGLAGFDAAGQLVLHPPRLRAPPRFSA